MLLGAAMENRQHAYSGAHEYQRRNGYGYGYGLEDPHHGDIGIEMVVSPSKLPPPPPRTRCVAPFLFCLCGRNILRGMTRPPPTSSQGSDGAARPRAAP